MDILEQNYRVESEIDNTFPYLDKLDYEIAKLQEMVNGKNLEHEKLVKKIIRRKNYFKDGYDFKIRLFKILDKEEENIIYYEFSVNILYDNLLKKNQFGKRFQNEEEAEIFFNNMKGFFKNLKRRDLVEKLINQKLETITKLQLQIKNN